MSDQRSAVGTKWVDSPWSVAQRGGCAPPASAAVAENRPGSGLRLGADSPTIQRVRLYRYR